MKAIYLAPANRLPAIRGAHDAFECPDPTMRLVIVYEWASFAAQDAFEAFPDVVLLPQDSGKIVPQAVVSAFAQSKVAAPSSVDTVEAALWKIRANFPAVR